MFTVDWQVCVAVPSNILGSEKLSFSDFTDSLFKCTAGVWHLQYLDSLDMYHTWLYVLVRQVLISLLLYVCFQDILLYNY